LMISGGSLFMCAVAWEMGGKYAALKSKHFVKAESANNVS